MFSPSSNYFSRTSYLPVQSSYAIMETSTTSPQQLAFNRNFIKMKYDSTSIASVKRFLLNETEVLKGKDSQQRTSGLLEISSCLREVDPRILSSDITKKSFLWLRQSTVNILQRWMNVNSSISKDEFQLFHNTIKLFKRCMKVYSKGERQSFCHYLCDSTLMETIVDSLRTFANTNLLFEFDQEFLLKSFIRLVRLYEKDYYQVGLRGCLIEPIQQCLLSNHYFNAFESILTKNGSMSDEEKFFLVKIPHLLNRLHEKEVEFTVEQIVKNAILKYAAILTKVSVSMSRWNQSMIKAVQYLILIINHPSANLSTTQKIISQNSIFIHNILHLLENLTEYTGKFIDKTTALIEIITNFLVNMISEPDFLQYVKEASTTEVFLRLTSFKDQNIVLNAHTLMAFGTTEKDIESITNPGRLLSVVIESLKRAIDQPANDHKNIDQLLRILKGFIQTEKLKDEVIKQNSLPTLIDFSEKLKANQLVQIVEILWSLSFREEIAEALRINKKFIENIEKLSKTGESEALKKVSDGMVWKLVREPQIMKNIESQNSETTTEEIIDEHGNKEIVTKTVPRKDINAEERKFPYDIMISYCHADKDLVYKIHKFLVDEGFKIWIDLDNMFGPAMSAMADAVENSEFVIMCMSDSYKNSTYCQAEAEYAFGRKRRLVPLIVKNKYRPDGWLGFLIGSRIYVDFGRFDFNTACDKLINEICLQRKQPLPSKSGNEKSRTDQHSTQEVIPSTSGSSKVTTSTKIKSIKEESYLKKYKDRQVSTNFTRTSINKWTESDVLDFLANQNLTDLMPIFENVDGSALVHLFRMAKGNDHQVYKIFRDELRSRFKVNLPLATYLRFISALEKQTPSIATMKDNDENKAAVSIHQTAPSSGRAGASMPFNIISATTIPQPPPIEQLLLTYRVSPVQKPWLTGVKKPTQTQPSILDRLLVKMLQDNPHYDIDIVSEAPPERILELFTRCHSSTNLN